MTETCATCKYIRPLYVPPIDAYKDIPKDKYVCALFAEIGHVMYMDDDKDMCEMYTQKDKQSKETVISKFVEDGILYEQIIRETKVEGES